MHVCADKHTHTDTHTSVPLMTPEKKGKKTHREEAISKCLLPIHVTVVNIFISWFCEVTVVQTARIRISQKWKWG